MSGRPAARRGPHLPVTTARLCVRELVAADQQAYRALMLDGRVAKHLPHAPDDAAAADRQFARAIAQQQRVRRRVYELALTRDGELVGVGDLTVTEPGMMNLGYAIAKRHWGQGYATEFAQALARIAFVDLGAPRLYATISVDNPRSVAVAEKAGLRWEATLRGRVRTRGRSWDMHLYVVDRDDWLAGNGDMLHFPIKSPTQPEPGKGK